MGWGGKQNEMFSILNVLVLCGLSTSVLMWGFVCVHVCVCCESTHNLNLFNPFECESLSCFPVLYLCKQSTDCFILESPL